MCALEIKTAPPVGLYLNYFNFIISNSIVVKKVPCQLTKHEHNNYWNCNLGFHADFGNCYPS